MFARYPYAMAARPALPPAVKGILLVTVGMFVVQSLTDTATQGWFTYHFGLSWPGLAQGQLWQLVSYLFLHANLLHLLLNLVVVYMFGRELETLLGARRFIWVYLGSGILAGLGWLLIGGQEGSYCIGASGSAFALIGGYAALFPNRPITIFLFFVLPMTLKARRLAMLLGLFTFAAMFADGNIAHSAHLTGGVVGYLYGGHVLRAGRRGKDQKLRDYFVGGGGIWGRASRPPAGWRVIDADVEEVASPTPEDIDRILDKILANGVGSLTRNERQALEQAARNL